MSYNTFPLLPRTDVTIKTDLNTYKINFNPGEKTQYAARDFIPPTIQEFTVSMYVDSFAAVETFIYTNGGYLPFYFHDGNLYVCKSYTCNYTDDDKGTFEMDLTRYTGTDTEADSYYSNVVLLVPFSDDPGASPTECRGHTLIPVSITGGSLPEITSTQQLFGQNTCFFNGSCYFTIPDDGTFSAASGNFTVEAWVYPTALSTGSAWDNCVVGKSGVGGTSYPNWELDASLPFGTFGNPTSGTTTTSSPTALTQINQWQHLALVKNGATIQVYLGGSLVGSNTLASSTLTDISSPVYIGFQTNQYAASAFVGYISNLRVTNGIARYTSNFIPSPRPFPSHG